MMKTIYYTFSGLLIIVLIICIFKSSKTIEHNITFTPPQHTNKQEADSMIELMRVGTQSEEDAQYDDVDTNLLPKT